MRKPTRRPSVRWAVAAVALVVGALTAMPAARPASAADNPYQRGPDPTAASVAATRGTFATPGTAQAK